MLPKSKKERVIVLKDLKCMDLYRSLLKTNHIMFAMILSFYFSFLFISIVQRWKIRNNLQFIFIDQTSPPDSFFRDPPQGPILRSHPRIPPESPTLGSHLRVPPEGPGSQSFGSYISSMPICRPQTCSFIKKETLAQVFSCGFFGISKNTFLHRTPLVAAFQSQVCILNF